MKKYTKLERTIDQIRAHYGYKAIVRGSSKKFSGTAIDRLYLFGERVPFGGLSLIWNLQLFVNGYWYSTRF